VTEDTVSTILVTGGAGYIGSELIEQLLESGHDVICLDRVFFGKEVLSDFMTNDRFRLVRDDVRTFDKKILDGVDVVMDLAGISNDPACELDPKVTEDINWHGAVRSATLAKEMGVSRYIFSSSCSVYGQGASLSLTEESSLAPVSVYARCKAHAEHDLLDLVSDDFCVTILRNATVYGPSRRMRYDLLVNLMTAKAFADRVVYVLGGGQQWRPNVHVRDVARAFCHVMSQPVEKVTGRIFNVGSSDQNFRVVDIAHIVRDVMPYVSIQIVPDDPDRRTYNVNFDRVSALGFQAIYSVPDAVAEIKHRMTKGTIWPFNDPRTKTLDYYAWLIKARQVLDDVCIDGRLF
jgi:nucleoside-diphosphate-sugar epimerase